MYALTISGTPARQMVTRVLKHMQNPRRREVAEAWLSSYPNGRADGAPDFRPAAKLHLVHGTS